MYPQKKRIFILVLIKFVSDIFDTTWRRCGGKRFLATANLGVAESMALQNFTKFFSWVEQEALVFFSSAQLSLLKSDVK